MRAPAQPEVLDASNSSALVSPAIVRLLNLFVGRHEWRLTPCAFFTKITSKANYRSNIEQRTGSGRPL